MNSVLSLYGELQSNGISFFTWELDDEKSATIEMNGKYGIFIDFDNIQTSAEELVIVAHEGGHAVTGSTHKVSSPYDLIEKHENIANRWAIKKLLPFDEMKAAMRTGHTEPHQLAEYFDVTEEFVHLATDYYRNACGLDFNS